LTPTLIQFYPNVNTYGAEIACSVNLAKNCQAAQRQAAGGRTQMATCG